MAIARKCDRCKKLFEPKLQKNGYLNAYHSISVRIENQNIVLDRLYNSDLCPECYEELRKWMEMEDEMDDDYCYECESYGDDYYVDDDGNLISRCLECPLNESNLDDD